MPTEATQIPDYIMTRHEAMRKGTWIQLACVAGAVVFLVVAGRLHGPINAERAQFLKFAPDVLKERPPKIVLTTMALGSFRGLAINYLWIRASKLKEEGKHYESLQLARWICDLQPRFPSVWAFQAWEMAYNISVMTHTPEERWQWVYNGIKLLRDEGIPLNPQVIGLYKELAWIINHKVGDWMDDEHWSYKCEWAAMFQKVLGTPPPNATKQEAIAAFRPIAEAPQRLDELLRDAPAVADYLQGLREVGLEADWSLLNALRRERRGELQQWEAAGTADQVQFTELQQERHRLLVGDEYEEPRRRLVAFVRAKILREEYKMDPSWMLHLMELYGPLDWRVCYAHALYWASLGIHRTAGLKEPDEITVLNTDRLVTYALWNLWARGQLVFLLNEQKPNRSYIDLMPDVRFIEPLHQVYLELGKKHDPNAKGTAGEMLRSGHVNFLQDAVRMLYIRGQVRQAAKYYEYLRTHYKEPDGSVKKMYLQPLARFVMSDVADRLTSHKTATELLYASLDRAYYALSRGDLTEYRGAMNWARRIYEAYMKGKDQMRGERQRLPPFEKVKADGLARFLNFARIPALYKARLWARVELGLRRRVYDRTIEALRRACAAHRPPLDPAKAFPEPPGMDEYRKAHPVEVRDRHEVPPLPAKKPQG